MEVKRKRKRARGRHGGDGKLHVPSRTYCRDALKKREMTSETEVKRATDGLGAF